MKLSGVANNHVIGYEFNGKLVSDKNGKLSIDKTLEIVEPVNLKAGKAINIARHIGITPIFAAGNSIGDLEMLSYTKQNKFPALCLVVDHDDSEREYKYDFEKRVWQAAKQQGWFVVSMKNDFKVVF